MKTVKVRIAVVVNHKGEWESSGWCYGKTVSDEDMAEVASNELTDADHRGIEATYFIEAELPVPEPTTVEGTVTAAKSDT